MALFLLIANWMILGGCVMCKQEQLAQDELGMGGGGVAKKRGGLMTFQVYIDREREERWFRRRRRSSTGWTNVSSRVPSPGLGPGDSPNEGRQGEECSEKGRDPAHTHTDTHTHSRRERVRGSKGFLNGALKLLAHQLPKFSRDRREPNRKTRGFPFRFNPQRFDFSIISFF
jgi:hypothetical protein